MSRSHSVSFLDNFRARLPPCEGDNSFNVGKTSSTTRLNFLLLHLLYIPLFSCLLKKFQLSSNISIFDLNLILSSVPAVFHKHLSQLFVSHRAPASALVCLFFFFRLYLFPSLGLFAPPDCLASTCSLPEPNLEFSTKSLECGAAKTNGEQGFWLSQPRAY